MDSYISELQEQFCQLANKIEERASDLSKPTSSSKTTESQLHYNQNALNSLKQKWHWLKCLTRSLDRHIDLATNYHVFYRTVREYRVAIRVSTDEARKQFAKEEYVGDYIEALKFEEGLKDLIALYLQWWQKVDSLLTKSKKIRPISHKHDKEDIKKPAVMLTDYRAKKLHIRKNEDIFVVDNTKASYWHVETLRGELAWVPSICCLLTGPDTDAVEETVDLRLDLLANWTTSLKEVGQSLVAFLLTVFTKWNKETLMTSSLSPFHANNKDEIMRLLGIIEETLTVFGGKDYPNFEVLRDRLRLVQASLSLYDKDDLIDDITKIDINSIFLQISPLVIGHGELKSKSGDVDETTLSEKKMLTHLLYKYQELSRYWEVFKTLAEKSSTFDSMLRKSVPSAQEENILELLGFVTTTEPEIWTNYLKRFNSPQSKEPRDDGLFQISPQIWDVKEEEEKKQDTWKMNSLSSDQLSPACSSDSELVTRVVDSRKSTLERYTKRFGHPGTLSDNDEREDEEGGPILSSCFSMDSDELPLVPVRHRGQMMQMMQQRGNDRDATLQVRGIDSEDGLEVPPILDLCLSESGQSDDSPTTSFEEEELVTKIVDSRKSIQRLEGPFDTLEDNSEITTKIVDSRKSTLERPNRSGRLPTLYSTTEDSEFSAITPRLLDTDESTVGCSSREATLLAPRDYAAVNVPNADWPYFPPMDDVFLPERDMDDRWSVGAVAVDEVEDIPVKAALRDNKYGTFPQSAKQENAGRRLPGVESRQSPNFGVVILRIPKKRVISVYDRRTRCQLSTDEAIATGVMDEELLTVLDTETQERYSFHEANAAGLLLLDSHSAGLPNSGQHRVVFRVDAVRDPQTDQMVNFVEAKARGLIESATAKLTCSLAGDRCDLVEGINRGLVKARRLYNYGFGRSSIDLSANRLIVAEH